MDTRLDMFSKNPSKSLPASSRKRHRQARKSYFAMLESLEPRLLMSAPTTWTNTGIGGTGTVYNPSINPNNSGEVYLGSDMGEVYHSQNFGDSWVAENYQNMANVPGSSSVQFTNDTNIRYAILGTKTISGVAKSTNAGQSWVSMASVAGTVKDADTGAVLPNVGDLTLPAVQIFADPTAADNTFITAERYDSGYSGAVGLYYKDSSNNWRRKALFASTSDNWLAGAFFDTDGNTIYLGTNQAGGVLVMTRSGDNWNLTWTASGLNTANERIFSMASAKVGSTIRLVCTTYIPTPLDGQGSACKYNAILGGCVTPPNYVGTYVATPSGTTVNWTRYTALPPTTSFVPALAGMARNANITDVVLGGMSSGKFTDQGSTVSWIGVYRTTTGDQAGAAWTSIYLDSDNKNNIDVYTGWSGDHVVPSAPPYEFAYRNEYNGPLSAFAVSPADPNQIIIGNQSEAWRTSDAFTTTGTWYSIAVTPATRNTAGVAIDWGHSYQGTFNETSVWGVTWIDKDDIFANCTDQEGIFSSDAGATWRMPLYGAYGTPSDNTTYATAEDSNGVLYAAVCKQHDEYLDSTLEAEGYLDTSSVNILLYSVDKGASWKLLSDLGTGRAIKAIAFDPKDTSSMYIGIANSDVSSGVNGVLKSTNFRSVLQGADPQGVQWTEVGNGLGAAGANGHIEALKILNDGNGTNPGTIAITCSGDQGMTNNGQYYVGGSGVFVLPTGQSTWVDRSLHFTSGNILISAASDMRNETMDLVIDPTVSSQSTWYVGVNVTVIGGDGNGGLYKTTDRGVTWTKIFSSPDGSYGAFSCAVDPVNPQEMFVSSMADGLYYTSNGGTSWSHVDSFPFARPTRVQFNPFNANEVWVSTFGNGMYKGTMSELTPLAQPTNPGVSVTGGTNYHVTWNDVDQTNTYYQVEYTPVVGYNAASGDSWKIASSTVSGTATSYDVNGLPSNVPYYFRVEAVTGTNTSPYSTLVSCLIPAVVSNVTAMAITTNAIQLKWDMSSLTTTGYDVQWSANGTSGWTDFNGATADAAPGVYTFTDTSLTAGLPRYYRVKAHEATATTWSSTVSATAIGSGSSTTYSYDGFDYPVDNLAGNSGGSGWNAGWVASGNSTFIRPLSSYPASQSTLQSIGNQLRNPFGAYRLLGTPLSASINAAKIVWLSYIATPGSDLSTDLCLGDATTPSKLFIGTGYWSPTTWTLHDPGTGDRSVSTVPKVAGQSEFVVIKISFDYSGSNDKIEMFINPPLGGSGPTNPVASLVNSDIGTVDRITLNASADTNAFFDEIRIGSDYAAVSPASGVSKPTVTISSAADSTASEVRTASAVDTGTFTFTRSGGDTTKPLMITYTNGGTATMVPGLIGKVDALSDDYRKLTGIVTIPAGQTSATVILTPLMDRNIEGTENAVLTIGTNAAYTVSGGTQSATVTIADANPALYKVSVIPGDYSASEPSNTGYFIFRRDSGRSYAADGTLVKDNGSAMTITYSVSGTATAGNNNTYDYQPLAGTATIAAGYDYAIVTVTPWDDTIGEPTDTVIVTITGVGTTYDLDGPGSATVYIFDNDNVVSPPAAPSNLAAGTPTQTTIPFSWTDNATDETSFTVDRATDVNFTQNTYSYTGIPAQSGTGTVNWTATGLTAGTSYYFRVRAIKTGALDSSNSNNVFTTTAAASGLIAYDGFNYSIGNLSAGTTNGGIGWTDPHWTSDSNGQVVANSLVAGSPANTLATVGNSITTIHNNNPTRHTTLTFGNDNTTMWASYLFNVGAGGWLDVGGIHFGNCIGNVYGFSDGTTYQSSSVTRVDGTTVYLVVKIAYGTGSNPDTVTMWLNPTPGSTEPSPATSIVTGTVSVGTSTAVTFHGENYGQTYAFDEVALGNSYADVAPVRPPAAPTNLAAGASTRTTMDLSWTDNSTDETSFTVDRATDVNFTQNTYSYTGIPAQSGTGTVNFTATGLAPDTSYYFRVRALKTGAPDSSNSTYISAVTSGLIAYDGFAYSTGNLSSGTTNGGIGWTDPHWTSDSNGQVVANSLVAGSPANTLATVGNSITTVHNNNPTRHTTLTFGNDNTTMWASYLFNVEAGGWLDVGGIHFGNCIGNVYGFSDGTTYQSSSVTRVDGTTVYLVVKIAYGTGSNPDTVTMWLNPTPGSTEPSPATSIVTGTVSVGTSTAVTFHGENYSQTYAFDEVRLGDNYADVAPPATYDGFESGNGSGGVGWYSNWALTGAASVVNNNAQTGTYCLLLTSNNAVASRAVDLSQRPGAHLCFQYKANSFEAGEYATAEIYNGTSWVEVFRISDPNDDNAYHAVDIDLSSYALTSSFQIRFTSHMSAADDYFYVDEIRI